MSKKDIIIIIKKAAKSYSDMTMRRIIQKSLLFPIINIRPQEKLFPSLNRISEIFCEKLIASWKCAPLEVERPKGGKIDDKSIEHWVVKNPFPRENGFDGIATT